MHNPRSGSTLGATLVITIAIVVVLAGLFKWVHTENRIARQSALETKAEYAAEASGEFALAQVRATLAQRPVITTNMFTDGNTPPAAPDAALLGDASTNLLSSLGASGSGGTTTYGLVKNLIGTLTTLTNPSSGGTQSTSSTSNAGHHVVETVRLEVSPFSAEQERTLSASNPLYANDPMRGETVNVRELRILAAARATNVGGNESAMGYYETVLQMRNPSLFRWVTFYNLDLEMSPAKDMDVFGPIHTNRNLYVQAGTKLNVNDVVTVAGGVYHGRAPKVSNSVNYGTVNFAKPDGTLVPMLQKISGKDTWVDSKVGDWTSRALDLWGGNVMTKQHGVLPLMPPPIAPDAPETPINDLTNSAHALIEPAIPNATDAEVEAVKYDSMASLVFEVATNTTTSTETVTKTSQVWNKKKKVWETVTTTEEVTTSTTTMTPKAYKYTADENGGYLRVVSVGGENVTKKFKREELKVPSGLWTYSEFYDGRWDKTVKSADLDIGKLKTLIEDSSKYAEWKNGETTFNPAQEWNGGVYVEQKNLSDAAIRLKNGSDIPDLPTAHNQQAAGFTIATNGPLYVWGDFNADGSIPSTLSKITEPEADEPPAAIIADAVTVLSNAWKDSNSTNTSSTVRKASQTEIAAAIIGGIVPSVDGDYSGGWHNMVRMLEHWGDVKLGFRSSMVVLYTSEVADTPWAGQWPVYEPPDRIFGLNEHFTKNIYPPLMRPVPTYRRLTSRSLTADEFAAALKEIGAE